MVLSSLPYVFAFVLISSRYSSRCNRFIKADNRTLDRFWRNCRFWYVITLKGGLLRIWWSHIQDLSTQYTTFSENLVLIRLRYETELLKIFLLSTFTVWRINWNHVSQNSSTRVTSARMNTLFQVLSIRVHRKWSWWATLWWSLRNASPESVKLFY